MKIGFTKKYIKRLRFNVKNKTLMQNQTLVVLQYVREIMDSLVLYLAMSIFAKFA